MPLKRGTKPLRRPRPVQIALAGCGYWGRNLARNLHQLGLLRAVCDPNPGILRDVKVTYPGVKTVRRLATILEDAGVNALAIAAR